VQHRDPASLVVASLGGVGRDLAGRADGRWCLGVDDEVGPPAPPLPLE
jgi:hypothetical protein